MYHTLLLFIYWPLRCGYTNPVWPNLAESSLAPLDSEKTGPNILWNQLLSASLNSSRLKVIGDSVSVPASS